MIKQILNWHKNKIPCLILLLAFTFFLAACSDYQVSNNESGKKIELESKESLKSNIIEQSPDYLIVHYIDVGQGDATLLKGPDFTILIDAGRHDQDQVVPYLTSVGVMEIDLLIGTHPHSDHIGQMDKVLKAFPVKEVWMSGATTTSRTFERVLDAILESEANYREPRAGEFYQVGSLQVKVLHPNRLTDNLNDDSLSMHMLFGDIAFIFTGDAERGGELAMVANEAELEADILQLGHHGSRTSTTKEFLDAVDPKIAIYSAGNENSYGHPHEEIITQLKERSIQVYGTDIYSTIKVKTNGKTFEVIKGDG